MAEPTSTFNQTESGRNVQPQLLRDRSRASGFDLVKLLVSLATGGVATYFIALTEPPRPPLSSDERSAVVISIVLMVAAVLTGLVGWGLDAAFFRYWAKSLESTDTASADKLWTKRRRYNRLRLLAMRLLAVFFMLGVAVSGYYVFLRSGRSASETPAEDRGGTGVVLGIKEQAVRVGGTGE